MITWNQRVYNQIVFQIDILNYLDMVELLQTWKTINDLLVWGSMYRLL